MKLLFFDTETTGLIGKDACWYPDLNGKIKLNTYPYICSIAWIYIDTAFIEGVNDKDLLNELDAKLLSNTKEIFSTNNKLIIKQAYYLITPNTETGTTIDIHPKAFEAHKLTIETLRKEGKDIKTVLLEFLKDANNADLIIGHNIVAYDIQLTIANAIRFGLSGYEKSTTNKYCKDCGKLVENNICSCGCIKFTNDSRFAYIALNKDKRYDIMLDNKVIDFVGATTNLGRKKWPTVIELYNKCFNNKTFTAHNALEDIRAGVKSFLKLHELNIINKVLFE